MIKKTVTYETLDGEEVTEDLYFHLSTAEIMAMETQEETLSQIVEKMMKSEDAREMMRQFTFMIEKGYAVRSEDGKRLLPKDPEVTKAFMESEAFDALIADLIGDEKAASEFLLGMFPKKLIQKTQEIDAAGVQDVPLPAPHHEPFNDPRSAVSGLERPYDKDGKLVVWWDREPTSVELMEMTQEQMLDTYKRKSSGWSPRTT